jgi:CHASE3 domain sensor protein
VPDEPTLGEVVRRMEAGFTDIKEDLREFGRRLDSKVSMERYDAEQRARDEAHKLVMERVKGIEDARLDQEQKQQADRRLIFTALVIPLLLIFLQVYLSARGASL